MIAGALRLRVVEEDAALPAAALAALQAPASAPGLRAVIQDAPAHDPAAPLAALQARTVGPVRPASQHIWVSAPTQVCRVADVAHWPRYGALVWRDGYAPHAPIGGALTDPDRLAEAPGFGRDRDGFLFAPPPEAPWIERAGVFMPWGGGFNYGHFLLDALPSLLALEEAGLLGETPPIAPPLRRWQRELIGLLRLDAEVLELAAPTVRLRQAAYATSMNHFLHAPNALMARTRARLLAQAGASPIKAERVYLSRRSHAHPMRILLNEAELERALAARGFAIVRPERLRPAEQIALAAQTKVLIGPTGAGMANALFAPPGALVVDIQPQIFPGAWVAGFGELVGHDWWVYCAPAPAPMQEAPWARRARRGFRFAYRLPLDNFLAFLDARL